MNSEFTHILIVDDEVTICKILGQYLKKRGYTVSTVQSVEQAIAIIDEKKIDLVITDIEMPGLTGVDLLKKVKLKNSTIPVLMTTGFPTLDTAIEALKLGAYDYLTKPFHLEEIGEKIRRAIISKEMEEENLLFSKLISLHEVTKVLTSTLDIAELDKKFLNYSIQMSKSDGGVLLINDSDSEPKLSILEIGGNVGRDSWANPVFTKVSKLVLTKGEPIVVQAGNSLSLGLPPLPSEFKSFISFPLKTPARTIGVLNLLRFANRDPFTNLDLETVNVLASQASISIENVRLYQDIRDNYLKTIRAFALAVEAKDEYTHGHSENVMKYTVVLSKHIGLPDQEIELVKYAGLLHDIGKIGVSEQILNKAGKLTDKEFEEIKKHPELGARIIEDVPFLKSLVPMVLHHHEFYCGGGYPTGISGTEIPFGARILSVSDAFEAMTSDRPYRKSLSQEVAFSILKKERGRQFDPDIIDAFLDIVHSTENNNE